jgi:hypothetical protein
MESWTGVTAKAATPQAGLIPLYGTLAASGISSSFLLMLARDYRLGIDTAAVNPDQVSNAYPLQWVQRFTPSYVEDVLSTYGHIMLGYRPSPNTSWRHVVVVYGRKRDDLLIMNPDPSVGYASVPYHKFSPTYTDSVNILRKRKP